MTTLCPELPALAGSPDDHAAPEQDPLSAGDTQRAYQQLRRYASDLQQTLRERESAYQQLYSYVADLRSALHRATLPGCCPRACAQYAQHADERGLSFEVVLPEFEVLPATLDQTRMRQALCALLDNAVKFTVEGGVIVTLHAEPESRLPLGISIADTGIGIAAEDRARIMNSFEQVDGSSTRCYDGAGLGLPVAKALLELLGCHLTLSSEPGRDSTFSISLPATPQVVGAPSET